MEIVNRFSALIKATIDWHYKNTDAHLFKTDGIIKNTIQLATVFVGYPLTQLGSNFGEQAILTNLIWKAAVIPQLSIIINNPVTEDNRRVHRDLCSQAIFPQ
jgi:hypothetical protein